MYTAQQKKTHTHITYILQRKYLYAKVRSYMFYIIIKPSDMLNVHAYFPWLQLNKHYPRLIVPLALNVSNMITMRIDLKITPKIATFMGPTWGPPGSCRPQMGPILTPWTLLWGALLATLNIRFRWHGMCLTLQKLERGLLVKWLYYTCFGFIFICNFMQL